jgi:hypothetical protein
VAYLNANIPPTYAQIRKEYLYDLKKHHGEVEDCIIFGISIYGWSGLSYGTHLWKMAQSFIASLLVHLFNAVSKSKTYQKEDLMNWSFGILLVIILLLLSWSILSAASGKYIGKDKQWHHGSYLFTVDWAHPDANILDTDHSEIPHEHKCAHIIALDDGNYAAQPNNRCIWDLPSFTVKDNIPDWKVQTNEWNVEDTGAWKTEDTDNFFYEIEEKK